MTSLRSKKSKISEFWGNSDVVQIFLYIYFSGQRQYFVKWLGTDDSGDPWENTWEPAENIEEHRRNLILIKNYWKTFGIKEIIWNKWVNLWPVWIKHYDRNKIMIISQYWLFLFKNCMSSSSCWMSLANVLAYCLLGFTVRHTISMMVTGRRV